MFISLYFICNGRKPLSFYFSLYLFCLDQDRCERKMGQKPKSRWVHVPVKANRFRKLGPESLSLSLSPSSLLVLHVCADYRQSRVRRTPNPHQTPFALSNSKLKMETLKMFEFESCLELKFKKFSFNEILKQQCCKTCKFV